ncbi:MAG: accessory gene regulator B family protein [Romboutsia sp.]
MGLEQISLNIANKLGENLDKSQEEIAILNYGLFIILHTSMVIVVTLIVGIIIHSVKEIMIIMFSSAMLKRYSGGIHAGTPMRCMFLGVTMSTVLALLCKVFVLKLNNIYLLMLLFIGIMISYSIIYKRCPVGTNKNPLKKESKRKLLRKKSFNLLNIYSIVIIMLFSIVIMNNSIIAKSISISMLFGTLIQIFALSEIGEQIIVNSDKFLDRIQIK